MSSADWVTMSLAVVILVSAPSTEANQRRTFCTISSWVSPWNDSSAMGAG
ncbi:MAG: hypothetical protein R2710_03215 [Acidimicrobiales bacterium]